MTPILHHFELSPFAEKVRAILGLKRMAWRSVLIPMVMPKPDVVALTGGYRRTPTLQIGADIYCDTSLIAQVLDGLVPEPPLEPASAPLASTVAAWADGTLFWQAIMVTQAPEARAALFAGMSPEAIKAVGADRAAFTAGLKRPAPLDAAAQLQTALRMFDRALAGQPWLLGAQPSIADFSVYHCLWFTGRAAVAETLLKPHTAVRAWFERMRALGHGTRSEISSQEALTIAADCRNHAPVQVHAGLGFEAGAPVTVAAIDYGTEPVNGKLVGLSIDRVTLERADPRAGLVHVHFPRSGFQVLRQSRNDTPN